MDVHKMPASPAIARSRAVPNPIFSHTLSDGKYVWLYLPRLFDVREVLKLWMALWKRAHSWSRYEFFEKMDLPGTRQMTPPKRTIFWNASLINFFFSNPVSFPLHSPVSTYWNCNSILTVTAMCDIFGWFWYWKCFVVKPFESESLLHSWKMLCDIYH